MIPPDRPLSEFVNTTGTSSLVAAVDWNNPHILIKLWHNKSITKQQKVTAGNEEGALLASGYFIPLQYDYIDKSLGLYLA